MAQSNVERQLRAGIRAAQQNNVDQARTLLEGVLRQDRNNELAWIWMASVVASKREKRVCLERVLQINPNNEPAREAINSLVGVVGEGDIDYNTIAAAAKTPLPAQTQTERRPTQPNARRNGDGISNVQIRMLLGVAAIVLGLLLAASFVLPAFFSAPEPTETATPTPFVEVTQEVTEEIVVQSGPPTATPLPGIVVTRASRESLPTNTPTLTSTPTVSPTPTATLPPLDQYTYLFVGNDNNLYRVDLLDGPRPVLDNVTDFDVRGGVLGFIRTTGASSAGAEATAEPDAAGQPTSQLFFAPMDNPGNALQVTRLTSGAVTSLAVSPDGSRIAYSSSEDGDEELYVVELETGITQRLTDNTTADTEPHWSPDGSQIVFASDDLSPSSFDMMVVNLGDGSIEVLVDTINSIRYPRFSPDGTRIAYIVEQGITGNLFVLELNNQLAQRQLTFDGADRLSPDWTPDGRYIVVASNQGSDEYSLVVRSLDGLRTEVIDTSSLQPTAVIAEP